MRLSPSDHERLGGSSSPPTISWTSLPEAAPTLSLPLCSCQRQALHELWISCLISSRTLFPQKHSSLFAASIPHSPYFFTYKISNSLSLTLVPLHLHVDVMLCHSTPSESHLCVLSASHHLIFYLQPTHTPASQSIP